MNDDVDSKFDHPTEQVPDHLRLENPLTGEEQMVKLIATEDAARANDYAEQLFALQRQYAALTASYNRIWTLLCEIKAILRWRL
jgi:hypothetical protein